MKDRTKWQKHFIGWPEHGRGVGGKKLISHGQSVITNYLYVKAFERAPFRALGGTYTTWEWLSFSGTVIKGIVLRRGTTTLLGIALEKNSSTIFPALRYCFYRKAV